MLGLALKKNFKLNNQNFLLLFLNASLAWCPLHTAWNRVNPCSTLETREWLISMALLPTILIRNSTHSKPNLFHLQSIEFPAIRANFLLTIEADTFGRFKGPELLCIRANCFLRSSICFLSSLAWMPASLNFPSF